MDCHNSVMGQPKRVASTIIDAGLQKINYKRGLLVRELAEYTIQRHFAELNNQGKKFEALLLPTHSCFNSGRVVGQCYNS